MEYQLRGVVLRSVKYRENDIIVSIYTDKLGRQDYAVKGAHRKKSKFRANLFQPLMLLDLEVKHHSNRTLHSIKECRVSEPLTTIHSNFVKSSEAMFISEFLYRSIQEVEHNSDLFLFIYSSIQMFDLIDSGVANFHIAFLLKLSRYLGFLPQLDAVDSEDLWFDMLSGSTASLEPFHKTILTPQESRVMFTLYKTDYADLDSIKIGGNLRKRLLYGVVEFYSIHLGHQLNIRSLKVLEEVYDIE